MPALVIAALATACEQPRYDPASDASAAFDAALGQSTRAGRHLMVVFGADWCPDCLRLYDNLQDPAVRSYMQGQMDFLTVDVGDKDRNLVLATRLGVSVENGIPVAVFFDPDGTSIGTTNDGQLEPSRHFTSRQILNFVRTIVDERRITQPSRPG